MDVLSQVKQNSAAREAAAYAAERQQVADRIALENAKRAEMARVMNQTPAQPQGLAAMVGYSDGSLEDAYKLQMAQKIADQNAIANMIAKNQEYNAARKDASQFGDKPDANGKYKLVPVGDGRADWDAQIPGGDVPDPISIGIDKLQKYFINKPRETVNRYQDTIDPGLAAKWMADREAFK